MKIAIGDYVSVIDDTVKGVVTKIEANLVYVKDTTQMEFHYLPSELVKIEESQYNLSKYSEQEVGIKKIQK